MPFVAITLWFAGVYFWPTFPLVSHLLFLFILPHHLSTPGEDWRSPLQDPCRLEMGGGERHCFLVTHSPYFTRCNKSSEDCMGGGLGGEERLFCNLMDWYCPRSVFSFILIVFLVSFFFVTTPPPVPSSPQGYASTLYILCYFEVLLSILFYSDGIRSPSPLFFSKISNFTPTFSSSIPPPDFLRLPFYWSLSPLQAVNFPNKQPHILSGGLCSFLIFALFPLLYVGIECQSSEDTKDCNIASGKCNHAFHFHCISRWLSSRNVCPLGLFGFRIQFCTPIIF